MEPWSIDHAGTFDELEVKSTALEGNPLGDPSVRPLLVYRPPGYDEDLERRYPSVYVIQGFTGQLDMWSNRDAFRPTYLELIDRLFVEGDEEGTVPPVLVVLVDCWTSLGGSQFLNSPATGRYLDYLCDDVVSFVDATYRTEPARDRRGIQGKSSGGYGAMVVPMLRPDVFGALASHAGDSLFEACYLPEIREAARALREEYDGSVERFLEDFRSRRAMSKPWDGVILNEYAMAAAYSADPEGTVQLAFEPRTGRLRPDVWERWLEHDPVRMVPRHADALRSMRGIYLDAGTKDEFYLDNGAVAVSEELDLIGVAHTLELFDDGHMGINYRYPRSLEFLARALAT